jgi:putative chitinase
MDTRRFNSECNSNLINKVYVTSPGRAYQQFVPYSHYNQPLEATGIRGFSRKWGDASFETQSLAIGEILSRGKELKFSDEELAFALSVARTESGFNPDAAAGTTSASGIGQLINKTASSLGVSGDKRFDLKENTRGFLTLLSELIKSTKRQFPAESQSRIFQRAYALYHDGPSLSFGGEKLAKHKVLPQIGPMLDFIRSNCLKTLLYQKN